MNYLTKFANSYYLKHKEELKRKRQVWYIVNKEKVRKKAKNYLRRVRDRRILPQSRINIGNQYISLGYK